MKNRFKPLTGTTYDDAGNVTIDNKFRDMNFAYDANGRMVNATRQGVSVTGTVYDGLGNRVATNIDGIWRYLLYDAAGKLMAEYGQSSDGVGGVKYVQQDWQGSSRTITNQNGFVISRTDHQPFGGDVGYGVGQRNLEKGYNQDPVTRQGFGLTETDSTGLNHTWFRKNESSAGRFTSPDPYKGSMELGNPQTFNRYSYALNDPVNYIDPSGLLMWACSETFKLAVTCVDGDCSIDFENSGWVTTCTLVSGGGYYPVYTPVSGGGTTPVTPPKQSTENADCGELAQLIKQIRDELAKRANDLIEDVLGLPPGPGPNTIFGHVQQYENKQSFLRSLLNQWNSDNCGGPGPGNSIPADAWKWASKIEAPKTKLASRQLAPNRTAEIVGGVVISAATAYVLYRIARMIPSLAPPLWPTIPANLAIP